MAQWILKENGKVVPRCTLRRLTPAELSSSNKIEMEKCSLFNVAIGGVLGDSVKIPKNVPLDNNTTKPLMLCETWILTRMMMRSYFSSLMLT
jgi:hypothetical protein